MSIHPTILRWLALLLLSLWGLGLQTPARALSPATTVLGQGMVSVQVDSGVELLIEEPGENLTPQQVLQPQMAGRWVAHTHKKINLPGQRKPVWIRFNLLHSAEPASEWLLAIDWPLLERIDFHQFDPERQAWVASQQGGYRLAGHGQRVKGPGWLFPLALGPGQRGVVLLKVQTSNLFVVPLTLWEEKAQQAQRFDQSVLMGLLFGILGVMFFYNLSLYAFTKERSFLTYSAYLASIVAYELAVTGYGSLYLWGDNARLKDRGYEFFGACSFLVATLFFRRFLELGNATRHLNRINQGLIGFWGVMTVAAIFPSSSAVRVLLSAGGIATSFAGVYTAAYLAAHGNILARYIVIAWTAIIVATSATLLSLMGVIEGGGWIDQSQHIGFVVETVLLSIALAERIKRERVAKEAAELESQELSRKVEHERDEKITAQEHALSLQRQANEQLELRVLDRTAELERTMKNLELANVELAKLSVTDALTKVHNRRYLDEALRKELDRSARSDTPLALVMADIDHFKKINDSVGHLAGDECLKLVATALASAVGRSTDLVARFGGEEFALVLPSTGTAQALEVAERAREAVAAIDFIYRGQRVPISISLGVVAKVAGANDALSDFVAQADAALYAAKTAGRNRVCMAG